MRRRNGIVAGLIVPGLIYFAELALAGSCGSAKLCCQGRDSGCVIQKESPNAIIASPRDKPCYCDHACLKLADCCDDFKQTCGVVDCAVSEWSLWTPCGNGCGSGTQRRTRLIEVSEKNGGKHCPRLDQVRVCKSYHGCRTDVHFQLHDKSVAILALFPDESNGTADGTIGGAKDNAVGNSTSCIAFTIVRASKACRKVSSTLSEGSRICVERRGNEVLESLVGIGRWELSGTPTVKTSCHGKWIGDSRLLVDCDERRCERAARVPRVTQLFRRKRRSVGIGNGDKRPRTRGRTVRRRRRGRRRKRSRRRRSPVREP